MGSQYISEYRYGAAAVGVTPVAVGNTALAAKNGSPRKSITIWNTDLALTLYLGSDNLVTAATGFPVLPGAQYIAMDDGGGLQWFGVTTAAGPLSARWLESY